VLQQAVKSLKGLNKYCLTASQWRLEFQKEEGIVDKSYASIKTSLYLQISTFSNNFTMLHMQIYLNCLLFIYLFFFYHKIPFAIKIYILIYERPLQLIMLLLFFFYLHKVPPVATQQLTCRHRD